MRRTRISNTLQKILISSLLGIAFILPMPAHAQQQQQNPNVDVKKEKFDDWEVICRTIPQKNNQEFCDMRQTVFDGNGNSTALAILGFKDDAKTQLGALFAVPLGILIPQGVTFQIDQNEKLKTRAPVMHCQKSGCFIEAGFQNDWVSGLKKGNTLNITFYNLKREPTTANLSLKGFSAAYNRISQ